MSSNDLAQFLPIVVLVVLAYLLLIRPARKRARATSDLQSALSVGDQVMLNSGIFGTVQRVADDKVGLEVANGVVLEVHRAAVGKIIHDEPEVVDPTADAEGSAYESSAYDSRLDGDDNREVS
ncbi:MAG: preprotein translocase subunit YajC [Nocardioidaceae bacterium]